MRRKLIQQDAFDQIANSSVTVAEHELSEAECILARALGKDYLRLHSFNENTVVYETMDNTYVHAGYKIKNENVTFNNIEELVIDHESKKVKQKSVLGEMIDAVLVDDNNKANDLFQQYMGMYSFTEAKKTIIKNKGDNNFEAMDVEDRPRPKGKLADKQPPWVKRKSEETRDKKKEFGKTAKGKQSEEFKNQFKKRLKAAGKNIQESYIVAENVLDYVDYMRVGPSLADSIQKADESGNVVDLRIPSLKLRNENRLRRSNWKTLNEKVHNLRQNALNLHNEQNFCKAMSDLRRQNALSNPQGLSEVLENVVNAWPHILYATQTELTRVVSEALATAGETRYDDQTCEFMAEGVLRTAHKAFQERVNQILHLASAGACEGNDPYEHFQYVVESFFPAVDEKFNLERKVFNDLYESMESLYRTADRRGDEALKQATAGYLNELADVLNDKSRPDVELAEEVATWLRDFIETNLAGGDWSVSNKPFVTVSGDHPDMAKKAAKGYAPASDFSGDWGDELPMIGQDSMNYKSGKFSKQARSDSWGNEENKDTFPKLKNPYVPEPFGDYTMKGEKSVGKDTAGSSYFSGGSKDAWPKLQNPYVPKAETSKTYKMNKGKEKDLIVDK